MRGFRGEGLGFHIPLFATVHALTTARAQVLPDLIASSRTAFLIFVHFCEVETTTTAKNVFGVGKATPKKKVTQSEAGNPKRYTNRELEDNSL